jgi:GDPmannose 4,6-dehydratase
MPRTFVTPTALAHTTGPFNHESPPRGETFVNQKDEAGFRAHRQRGMATALPGNLEARRDGGYAPEYVQAMWLMLQSDPGDYVIGTGIAHSVREFLEVAFASADSIGKSTCASTSAIIVPPMSIPLWPIHLKPAASLDRKAQVSYEDMAKVMVDADLVNLGLSCPGEGRQRGQSASMTNSRKHLRGEV